MAGRFPLLIGIAQLSPGLPAILAHSLCAVRWQRKRWDASKGRWACMLVQPPLLQQPPRGWREDAGAAVLRLLRKTAQISMSFAL